MSKLGSRNGSSNKRRRSSRDSLVGAFTTISYRQAEIPLKTEIIVFNAFWKIVGGKPRSKGRCYNETNGTVTHKEQSHVSSLYIHQNSCPRMIFITSLRTRSRLIFDSCFKLAASVWRRDSSTGIETIAP